MSTNEKLEKCLEIVARRCADFGLDRDLIRDVQYGDPGDIFPDMDHLAATLESPTHDTWMILISEKTPDELLEEVVTHEVLHVLFASEKDDGEETLVDMCAKTILWMEKCKEEIETMRETFGDPDGPFGDSTTLCCGIFLGVGLGLIIPGLRWVFS